MTLKIHQHPRIPLCIKAGVLKRNCFAWKTSNSKQRAVTHWRDDETMYVESKRTKSRSSSAQCLRMTMMQSLEKCSCKSSKKDAEPGTQPYVSCLATGKLLWSWKTWVLPWHPRHGWQQWLYTSLPFPWGIPTPVLETTPSTWSTRSGTIHTNTSSALRLIFTHMCGQKQPTSSRCWTMHAQLLRKKKGKQSRGRRFHPTNSGEEEEEMAGSWRLEFLLLGNSSFKYCTSSGS